MIEELTRTYASMPTKQGDTALEVDIYFPETDAPLDLVVWIPANGFRNGTRINRMNHKIAKGFADNGYATAFIDLRSGRPFAVLRDESAAQLPALIADARAEGEEMPPLWFGERAIAAVEDVCAFLAYADTMRDEFGLSGRIILGGSSTGAITAINTLYLPQVLGMAQAQVATTLAFSGGFAYPGHIGQTGARILAINGPMDEKMPISSIRRLARRAQDHCLLIESEGHQHGAPSIVPEEDLADAIDRCVAFDRTEDIQNFDIWQRD